MYLICLKKCLWFLFHFEMQPCGMPQGTFRIASWRGIEVAVKKLGDGLICDEDKVLVFHKPLIIFMIRYFLIFVTVFKAFLLSPAGGHLEMNLHCFRKYGIQM